MMLCCPHALTAVERLDEGSGSWEVVHSDDDWSTKFEWGRCASAGEGALGGREARMLGKERKLPAGASPVRLAAERSRMLAQLFGS